MKLSAKNILLFFAFLFGLLAIAQAEHHHHGAAEEKGVGDAGIGQPEQKMFLRTLKKVKKVTDDGKAMEKLCKTCKKANCPCKSDHFGNQICEKSCTGKLASCPTQTACNKHKKKKKAGAKN